MQINNKTIYKSHSLQLSLFTSNIYAPIIEIHTVNGKKEENGMLSSESGDMYCS